MTDQAARRFLKTAACRIPSVRRVFESRDAAVRQVAELKHELDLAHGALERTSDQSYASRTRDKTMFAQRKRPLVIDEPPTFECPDSQLVSHAQIQSPRFEYWRQAFRMRKGLNRKLWEYLYIANAIDHYMGLDRQTKALGFGVGRERIPAVLAAQGCTVVATDYPSAEEWSARSLDDLREPLASDTDPALADQPICDDETFRRNVTFRHADMNSVPGDLRDFDCLWSCGSFEHIGGLEDGLNFVMESMSCLRPGGFAVHTTEFNLSSNDETLNNPDLCFYRRRDIEDLAMRLQTAGHHIVLNFHRGNSPVDCHIDKPPFDYALTMNALHGDFVVTSIGLIIQKKG